MAFMLLFGRRFVAYLTIVVAIGAMLAVVVALFTAQPAGALGEIPIQQLSSAGSPSSVQQPVELALTGPGDITLSLVGAALVLGGGFLLVTANKVDQTKR